MSVLSPTQRSDFLKNLSSVWGSSFLCLTGAAVMSDHKLWSHSWKKKNSAVQGKADASWDVWLSLFFETVPHDMYNECVWALSLCCLTLRLPTSDKSYSVNAAGSWQTSPPRLSYELTLSILICLSHMHTHTLPLFSQTITLINHFTFYPILFHYFLDKSAAVWGDTVRMDTAALQYKQRTFTNRLIGCVSL